MVIAIVVLIIGIIIWEQFDLETKILGYRYSEYFWGRLSNTVESIPAMIESILEKVRNL